MECPCTGRSLGLDFCLQKPEEVGFLLLATIAPLQGPPALLEHGSREGTGGTWGCTGQGVEGGGGGGGAEINSGRKSQRNYQQGNL